MLFRIKEQRTFDRNSRAASKNILNDEAGWVGEHRTFIVVDFTESSF